MAGSPGSGKTLLARALPSILPEMSIEASLEMTRIYSARAYHHFLKLARTIVDLADMRRFSLCIWQRRCTLRGRPKLFMG
jgi:predicted ATPase with chaperone activity